jgi:hypothetical protein
VTALKVADWRDPNRPDPQVFVVSAYRDAVVRVWDLFAKCPVFELAVEKEAPLPLPVQPPQPPPMQLMQLLLMAQMAQMGTDVGPLVAQMTEGAKPQHPPSGSPLVPIALDFSIAHRVERAELLILALDSATQRPADGELITFTFPFGKEGELLKG